MAIYLITSPTILTGVVYHVGRYRINFDVPLTGKKILLLLNNAGTKPPLPKSAASFIGSIDILNITLPQTLHESPGAI
jgi:hypothetical protein